MFPKNSLKRSILFPHIFVSEWEKNIFHRQPLMQWLSNTFYNHWRCKFQRTAAIKLNLWAQCRLTQVLQYAVARVDFSTSRNSEAGSRAKINTVAFVWTRQTCWCPCLQAESLPSITSALSQALKTEEKFGSITYASSRAGHALRYY